MGVCHAVIENSLPTLYSGDTAFGKWRDNQKLSALFEHFVLEYYRAEHPDLQGICPSSGIRIGQRSKDIAGITDRRHS